MEIWRGGQSTKAIKLEQGDGIVSAGGAYVGDHRQGVTFSFLLPSKGGGTTRARLWVPAEEFGDVARQMLKGAPDAGRIALLEALLDQADPGRRRRQRLADRGG